MAKVGFIAHPMQNSIRNMIGTLVLFFWWPHDEYIKDFGKPLDGGFQSGRNSGLAGNSNHRYGKCHYHMGLHGYLAGVIFCKSHLQIFFMATIFNWIM